MPFRHYTPTSSSTVNDKREHQDLLTLITSSTIKRSSSSIPINHQPPKTPKTRYHTDDNSSHKLHMNNIT